MSKMRQSVRALASSLRAKPTVTVVRELLGRRVLSSVLALYGGQIVHYLLPLVMIPYLARVLGPESWGTVMFVQAVGMYLMLFVEYSFELSATREVARIKDDIPRLAIVVSGVLGARIFLAFLGVGLLGIAYMFVPAFQQAGALYWLAIGWYVLIAFRPFWFFLALEQVGWFIFVEVSTRVVAVAAIIISVGSPSDAWKVIAFQGLSTAITVGVSTISLYRRVPFKAPTIPGTKAALREGWNMFVFRASRSVYAESNTVLLGLLATPSIVAFYAGAQRLSHSLITMMLPFVQAIFPRVSSIAKSDPMGAAKVARLTMVSFFIVASVGAVVMYFLSPFVIRIILGPDYSESVAVLRILLLLLPILALSQTLGSHWMIPVGLDSLLTKITFAGGIFHIPVAIALGIHCYHIGVAWAIVITEGLMLVTLMTVLLARGLGPFRLTTQPTDANTGGSI